MKIFAAVADGSVVIFKRNKGNRDNSIFNPSKFRICLDLYPRNLLMY